MTKYLIPTKKDKEILNEFKYIIRMKRRYNKWWQTYFDNQLVDLLESIEFTPNIINKINKNLKYYNKKVTEIPETIKSLEKEIKYLENLE